MEQISSHPFVFTLEIDQGALGLNLNSKGNADVQKGSY